MPAMTSFFRPLSSRSGIQSCTTGVQVGTGGMPLTATATVSVHIPIPRRKCKLLSINVDVVTAAVGSGAITAQAFRRNNIGTPADVTIGATFDLTATKFTTTDKAYNMAITATDTQTIFQTNDTLRVDLVAAGTVSTAPNVSICAEWGVLN